MLGSSAWYRSFPVSMGVITTLISTIVRRTLKDRWFDVEGSSDESDTAMDATDTSANPARHRQRPMWRASLPLVSGLSEFLRLSPVGGQKWPKMAETAKMLTVAIVERPETFLELCSESSRASGPTIYGRRRTDGRTRPSARVSRQRIGVKHCAHLHDTRSGDGDRKPRRKSF